MRREEKRSGGERRKEGRKERHIASEEKKEKGVGIEKGGDGVD